jgi:uncharacterized membrane protein
MVFSAEITLLFLMGACGALVKDLFNDGCIELPKKIDGKYSLGFLSSIIIGAFAGYIIDGSLVTAFMGGFMGSSVITSLIPKTYVFKSDESKKFDSSPLGNGA